MDLHSFFAKNSDILPAYVPGHITLRPQEFFDPAELEKYLADWNPAEGWASRQSQVQVIRGDKNGLDQSKGHILAAEFTRDGLSLHIRQKQGGWVVTQARETEGVDVLVERKTFIADAYLAGDCVGLLYHRYWVLDHDDCPKQLFAAFRGFVTLDSGGKT